MSHYRITAQALTRLAGIEFERFCQNLRHVELDSPVMNFLEIDRTAQEVACDHEIAPDAAKGLVLQAWAQEGKAIFSRWDVRAITSLIDAIPSVLAAKYRNAVIRGIENGPGGECVIHFDSEFPRYRPEDAAANGFELIARVRSKADLQQSVNNRIASLVQSYQETAEAQADVSCAPAP